MALKIKGFAAYDVKGELKEFEYDAEELKSDEVLVEVKYCGICYSDCHMIDNDWNMSTYPFIPGHEAVGVVARTGSGVRKLKEGDKVGVGWLKGSCMTCRHCASGHSMYCKGIRPTCVNSNGGFATHLVAQEEHAHPIPEELPMEEAAPMLCGGITVWTPFEEYDVKPGSRVGIVGLGGLGHYAVQFAAKKGFEVTVFTTSESKKEEAMELGAQHVVNSKEESQLDTVKESFDFILVTAHADLDWEKYVTLLDVEGKLCFVGVTPSGLKLSSVFPLIAGKKSICGSPFGTIYGFEDMFKFAAKHGIRSKVEVFPLNEVNTAIKKLKENKVHFRAVLKI